MEQGSTDAMFALGTVYSYGEGVPQSFKEAVRWYRKAADQGHAGAQFNLGNSYLNGEGVPQSFKEAACWCRKAADQGDADAQFKPGNRYSNDCLRDPRRPCAGTERPQTKALPKRSIALVGPMRTAVECR